MKKRKSFKETLKEDLVLVILPLAIVFSGIAWWMVFGY